MATLITPGERVEGLGGYVVKPVIKKFKAQSQSEGAGFVIRRPIGRTLSDEEADPFLLLDELGPVSYAKGEFPGAPWHPQMRASWHAEWRWPNRWSELCRGR